MLSTVETLISHLSSLLISNSEPTTNIPISVYKRLIQDSVRLQKSLVTIEILTKKLHKKSEEIRKLKTHRNHGTNQVSKLIELSNAIEPKKPKKPKKKN